MSPALQADSLPAKPQGKSAFKWETIKNETVSHIYVHYARMCKRHTYTEKGESRREGRIKQIRSLPEIAW